MVSSELENFFKRISELEKRLREYIKREIEDTIRELRRELIHQEDMFKPMWHHEGYLRPLYSIRDRGSFIEIYVDLPRADEKSIDIWFKDNYVYIRARLKEDVRFHRLSGRSGEIEFQEYREVVELPFKIDPNRVRVDARRGRVKITIYR